MRSHRGGAAPTSAMAMIGSLIEGHGSEAQVMTVASSLKKEVIPATLGISRVAHW